MLSRVQIPMGRGSGGRGGSRGRRNMYLDRKLGASGGLGRLSGCDDLLGTYQGSRPLITHIVSMSNDSKEKRYFTMYKCVYNNSIAFSFILGKLTLSDIGTSTPTIDSPHHTLITYKTCLAIVSICSRIYVLTSI